MRKYSSLIVTLPSLADKKNVDLIMRSEEVSEVRYNSGINDLYDEFDTVSILKTLRDTYKKRIWIDLKGRQLRITSWADPRYEAISLNHEIEIEYPAEIIFRGGHSAEIAHTRGNKIVLASAPRMAVGKGQSVNIRAKSLNIHGYLTPKDVALIKESSKVGLNDYMASFVESSDDLKEILNLNNEANIVSKIESQKGINFILRERGTLSLMAARDDLFIECGYSVDTLKYLREIIKKDKDAICASRIFSSLEKSETPSLSDFEDLELMSFYGYKRYMLGDDFKGEKLTKALKLWGEFKNG